MSAQYKKQAEDLAEISATLGDNPTLQAELDGKVRSLLNAYESSKQMEDAQAERERKVQRFRDNASKVAARVKTLTDDLGTGVKTAVEMNVDCCDDADCETCLLCKYEYLKKKEGMTKKKIKLALGL